MKQKSYAKALSNKWGAPGTPKFVPGGEFVCNACARKSSCLLGKGKPVEMYWNGHMKEVVCVSFEFKR